MSSDPMSLDGTRAMGGYFQAITLWLATGTEASAAVLIGLAVIEGTIGAIWLFVPGTTSYGGSDAAQDRKEEVRLRLVAGSR